MNYRYFPGSRFSQLKKLWETIVREEPNLIVSHSLRGGVLSYILNFLSLNKFQLKTFIHQIPSLSSKEQRLKRFLYSRFSQELFIFSEAARQDWLIHQSRSWFVRFLSGSKPIILCRNGVFLSRLKSRAEVFPSDKRLIFIGRLRTWKGIDKFIEIVSNFDLADYSVVLVTPEDPSEYLLQVPLEIKRKFTYIIGKSVSEIDFRYGDIHLYPTNYGKDSRFVEGVSINVLEMAALGIVSLISKDGDLTWPELKELGLIRIVNWDKLSEVTKTILSSSLSITESNLNKAREIIDIKNNLRQILEL